MINNVSTTDLNRIKTGKTPHRLPIRQAIVNLCHAGARELVGGIPLAGRTLYHLSKIGIAEAIVLAPDKQCLDDLKPWQGGLQLRQVAPHPQRSNPAVPVLNLPRLQDSFLYIDAAHLIDPRIIRALAVVETTTLAFMSAADMANGQIRAAFLHRRDLEIWDQQGDEELVKCGTPLTPLDIDPFSAEVRGELIPYFVEVRSAHAAKSATKLLIRSQQKQVMDLPAEYLDPPFENALTYLLCQTAITPNMITLLGVAVVALVVWLFWHGYFVAGALLTFPVEILDGVDGKLARTKLQFSKLGQHEDVIDYFCENSWYIALGVGLSSMVADNFPFFLAALLIVADTTDNVCYTLAGKWYGKSIDLFSPFDSNFRRIAGRRNIYAAMFVIGFLLGYPLQTFAVTAFWAAATALIHGVRLLQYGRANKRLAAISKVIG